MDAARSDFEVAAKLAEHLRYWRPGNAAAEAEKGLEQVGKFVERGIQWVGNAFSGAFRGAANAISDAFKNVANTLINEAKKFLEGKIGELIDKVRTVVGIDLTVIREAYNPQTKQVDKERVKQHVVAKLKDFLLDKLKDLSRWALDRVYSVVRPGIEAAINGIVGALGSTPFVGGALAALASIAAAEGVNALKDLAARGVESALTPLLAPLFEKGLGELVGRFPPVQSLLNWAMAQVVVFEEMVKR
jgi:hypothetical protein